MIRLTVNMHRRHPGHEVKAIITFTDDAIKDKHFKDNQKDLKRKLEQVIPMSLRIKYVENHEGIALIAKFNELSAAHRVQKQLQDYIRSATQSLNFKIVG